MSVQDSLREVQSDLAHAQNNMDDAVSQAEDLETKSPRMASLRRVERLLRELSQHVDVLLEWNRE